MEFVLAGLLIAAVIAALSFAWWRRRQRPAPCLPQQYEIAPRPGTFALQAREQLPPVVHESPVLEAQSPAWRAAMQKLGQRLLRAGVRRVVFVHGTFVGHDPSMLLSALEGPHSALGPACSRSSSTRRRRHRSCGRP